MAATIAPPDFRRMVDQVGLSGPVDMSQPYDASSLAGKTVLITGGASGIGAAIARRWASHGAFVAIGDMNVEAGEALVAELRASSTAPGKQQTQHFFQRCDVTDWQSQVDLFRATARASPTGGIDAVVPAAGISERQTPISGTGFENPSADLGDESVRSPAPPRLAVVDVNLTGVLYSVHLALFWLGRNGERGGKSDRHILLVGSASGIFPLPGQPLYCASKHALTGLFRAMRATAWRQGVRINLLCPYFVDTPLIPTPAMAFMAGAGLATVDGVVEAATRLAADEKIAGRALAVGPKFRVSDDGEVVQIPSEDDAAGDGAGQAAWECYAHDYETVEAFVWRYARMLNAVESIRGWVGWARDMIYILFYRKAAKAKR